MYETVAIFLAYIMLRYVLQHIIAPRLVSENKTITTKFRGSVWRSFAYTVLLLFGLFTLCTEDWVLSPSQYSYKWPANKTPYKIVLYYKIEMIHYALSLVYVFIEPKMKDFNQMVVHHIVTLYLILVSYRIKFLRYGAPIMLLHDFSDPFMEIGKTLFYLKKQEIADQFFVVFAAIFVINRCFLYTTFIVYPVVQTSFVNESRLLMLGVKFCLVSLAVINLIWAFMIGKMAVKLCKSGSLKDGDIRTDKMSVKQQKKNK